MTRISLWVVVSLSGCLRSSFRPSVRPLHPSSSACGSWMEALRTVCQHEGSIKSRNKQFRGINFRQQVHFNPWFKITLNSFQSAGTPHRPVCKFSFSGCWIEVFDGLKCETCCMDPQRWSFNAMQLWHKIPKSFSERGNISNMFWRNGLTM